MKKTGITAAGKQKSNSRDMVNEAISTPGHNVKSGGRIKKGRHLSSETEALKASLKAAEEALNRKKDQMKMMGRKYRVLFDNLRESEIRYRELVEHARSIILKMDTDGRFIFFNEYAQKLFGFTNDEIIGKTALETIVPEVESTGRRLVEMLDGIYSDPDSYGININENIKKNGERLWVEWYNNAIFDSQGNRTGHIAVGHDITNRILGEKLLKESEEKYRKIVETAAEGILTTGGDGRFVYANDKMLTMLGYQLHEVLGKSMLDFMYDDAKEQVLFFRREIKHRNLSGEFKFRRKDGSLLWTSYNASAMIDSSGNYTGNLEMHTDITERKKWEEDLYKSEERFRTAFEKGTIAMSLTSLKGEFIRINRAFSELTGYSEEELKGLMFVQLTHPDDQNHNIDGFNRIITGASESFRMEKRYIRKDGKAIWVDISTAPVRDNAGNIEYMVTHVQDIDDRKTAERELEDSQEKLEIALESGHIGIWERILRNDKVIWDRRMERIFGLAPGTFKGDYTAFEELINEEDLPHFRKALIRSIADHTLFETVFRTRIQNGSCKYISSKALIKDDENGVPVSLTGICFDVTGVKEDAQRVIFRLNEELMRSNKELESFAYVASHDLQEPLRMVSSFMQMLEQKYGDKLDKNAQEYIRYAVDGAKRMYELINGLLAYSRIQTKAKEFSLVSMSDVFEKVKRNLNRLISEKNAVVYGSDLPAVFADESQMIQLVQNLIENGIKFCQRKPEVHFSAKDNNDCYLFSISDTGIGIESQYFERIFKIFQRLMPKEEFGGTGIGLAICKRIVERHNGEIRVESRPGEGSTFYFTIPKN